MQGLTLQGRSLAGQRSLGCVGLPLMAQALHVAQQGRARDTVEGDAVTLPCGVLIDSLHQLIEPGTGARLAVDVADVPQLCLLAWLRGWHHLLAQPGRPAPWDLPAHPQGRVMSSVRHHNGAEAIVPVHKPRDEMQTWC